MTARNLKMFSRSGSHYGGVVVRELVGVKMKPDICKKLEDHGLEDKPAGERELCSPSTIQLHLHDSGRLNLARAHLKRLSPP